MELKKKKVFAPKVGVTTATLKLVNPTNKELAEFYGSELDPEKEEPKYEGTDKVRNVDTATIALYFETPDGFKFNKWITIADDIATNSGKDKIAYVTQVLDSQYVTKPSDLFESNKFFMKYDKNSKGFVSTGKEKIYRKANVGELQLYNIVRSIIGAESYNGLKTVYNDLRVDLSDSSVNLLLDIKQLFKNPKKYVKTYFQDLLADDSMNGPVCVGFTVTKKEDGTLQQSLTNFLSGPMLRHINVSNTAGWQVSPPDAKRKPVLETWYNSIVNPSNGKKVGYSFDPLHDYEEDGLPATNETLDRSNEKAPFDSDDSDY
jgi:hypothetical protein